MLNVHLSLATKDSGAVRIYSEPLADFTARNELMPVLAAEIPSLDNGGLAKDRATVTWKLKRGVTWHDGHPFTAADVAFTFRYLREPATSATTLGYYQDVADIGLVARNNVAAASTRLTGYQPTPWTPDVWDIKNWRFD